MTYSDPTPASLQEATAIILDHTGCGGLDCSRCQTTIRMVATALDARTQATARTCAKEIETFSMAILTGETGQNLSNPITVSEILKLMSSKIRHTFGLRDESTNGGRP